MYPAATDEIDMHTRRTIECLALDEKDNVKTIRLRLQKLIGNIDPRSTSDNSCSQQTDLKSRKAKIIKYLRVLAEIYCEQCTKRSSISSEQVIDADDDVIAKNITHIGLECQEIGYDIVGGSFTIFDDVMSAAFSLLALTAKNVEVRKRYRLKSNILDIERLIHCLRMALERAINDANTTDTNISKEFIRKRENIQAEIQRKGCLLLGALSDSDADLARIIAEKGGFEIILNAIDWYRLHEHVCKWGLWSIFIMTQENQTNKFLFVSLNGVPRVIQVMRNCPDSLDVARHGIAILFDLLRDQDVENNRDYDPKATKIDVWKVRQSAVDTGLHDVIENSISVFHESPDIVMMGQELLHGTGWTA